MKNNLEENIKKIIEEIDTLLKDLKNNNKNIYKNILKVFLSNQKINNLEDLKKLLERFKESNSVNEILEKIQKIKSLLETSEIDKKKKNKYEKNVTNLVINLIVNIQIKELRKILENNKLSHLEYKELLSPAGYTECLAYRFKDISVSQVRKLFEKMKKIYESNNKEKAKIYIYETYPLLAYAEGRKLISKELVEIFQLFLEDLDKSFNEENLKKFKQFLIGFLGYLRKYSSN